MAILHVDGGLIDNLPIDVMAEQCGGAVIAVDVSPEQDLRSELDLARGFFGLARAVAGGSIPSRARSTSRTSRAC